MDHKKYVGGNWDTAGKKQFDFLVKEEGLLPGHKLLDIGCGCFRAGRYFIDYLDEHNYYGVEHHEWLVEAGFKEIGKELKTILINDNFEFDKINCFFEYAIAKSVFTHLTKDKIQQCLDNLYNTITPDGALYASIWIGDSSKNPKECNDTRKFQYSLEEISELASDWDIEVLGTKGTFKQTMLKFKKKKNMNVSIITAGYNIKYLDQTWESIKKQTHKGWEWILVNDNSMDVFKWYNDKKFAREFENYEVYFVDVGRSMGRYGLPSRNIGVYASNLKYPYWIWLDDDVSFEEDDYIEKMINASKKTGKIAFSQLHLIGKRPGSTYDRYKKTHPSRNHIDCGNILYKKRFIPKYGLLSDHKNRIVFDADYIEKIREGEGGADSFIGVDRNLRFMHKRY